MRLKLDENLPVSLCSILAGLGHDVDTAQDEGLAGEADDRVWQAAQSESRFFLTQDLDFRTCAGSSQARTKACSCCD